MCIIHKNLHIINMEENKIKQMKKCAYCEFKSERLFRCREKNIDNGLCKNHKL